MQEHHVYIVECSDGTLYTGYAIDIKKRLQEHNGKLPGGAKFTQGRRPVSLKYSESFSTRSEALKREYAIKQLSRTEKYTLIQSSDEKSSV